MNIYYLPYESIDLDKWDRAIMYAFNGNAYGLSWFLNHVAPRWDALVADDYTRVMPLPRRRKFMIDYIYQPFLAEQLGIYSRKSINQQIVAEFLDAIPSGFRYVELNLNIFNPVENKSSSMDEKYSYELDLLPPYAYIRQQYSPRILAGIRHARTNNIHAVRNISLQVFMQFVRTHLNMQLPWINEEHFLMMKKLASFGMHKRIARFTAAYNKFNEPIAMIFWLKTHRKIFYILSVANKEGMREKAMFSLIDEYIRANSEKNLILAFGTPVSPEGSQFFKEFGAVASPFIHYRRNTLPFPLKLHKH